MTIDFIASQAHYLPHLMPIWDNCFERGNFYAPTGEVEEALISFGIAPVAGDNPDGAVVVAAALRDLRKAHPRSKKILMEHGCGQSYSNNHPAYAGGRGHDSLALILAPNEFVAERSPSNVPCEIVGTPKMDSLFKQGSRAWSRQTPVVCLSFHWRCEITRESGTALDEYRSSIPALHERFPYLIGHGHPRIQDEVAPIFESYGVPFCPDFATVQETADLYVVDNSSTLWEFAATNRPTVAFSASSWRRTQHHGMRFWDAIPGPDCDHPQDLADTIHWAIQNDDSFVSRRRDVTQRIFTYVDGSSTQRALRAILAIHD